VTLKSVASQTAKMDTDLESPVLVELDVLEEPRSEVITELESEPDQIMRLSQSQN